MSVSAAPRTGVICVLGMHRSGTSMVSRLLNLLGVHLGPDERVLTSGDENPKGFWEYRPFVDINDEILARFAGRWDDPPAFPHAWWGDPNLSDLRQRARELLAEDFAGRPLWGWKDPRACLTLPFWQDLIGPMRYVVCVRNPCAVAASIVRRDGMSGAKAEWLWLRHMQAILEHTSEQPRTFVFYEDVIDDPRPALRRLAAFLGDPERAGEPRILGAFDAFFDREMCHHRLSIEDLVGEPRTSFSIQALYVALMGARSTARDLSADGTAPNP